MKTLIKTGELELIRNYQDIILLQTGIVIAKFPQEQLLPAIIGLVSLINQKANKLSLEKLMANFQPDLF